MPARLCFYDIRPGHDLDYAAQIMAGASSVWTAALPGTQDFVARAVRKAADLAIPTILNLTPIIWQIPEAMSIRSRAIDDYAALDAALSREGLWPWVHGFYVADEPFWWAASAARVKVDKVIVAESLRVVNQYLARAHPRIRRYAILSWIELLLDEHPAAVPLERGAVRDGFGCTAIGFAHYSERDGQSHGDTKASYDGLFDRLRHVCPNTARILAPDGVMFAQDELTVAEKVSRLEWILKLADEPDVTDVIPYCWSVASVGQQGTKETPELLAFYTQQVFA